LFTFLESKKINSMTPSKNCIDLIKKYEGCQLKAYLCPANKATIGYGNTFWQDGKPVKMGEVITLEGAEKLLLSTLSKFVTIIQKKVTVQLNQNQFDSLLSYTFNTGGSLTLYNLINSKASNEEIRTWFETKYISAKGKVLEGLIKRRKEEANLYFTI